MAGCEDRRSDVRRDLRATRTWTEVSEFFRRLHEPGGRRTVDKAPDWMPHVEGGRGFANGRALWLADIDQRTARRVTGDELTVWEAAWAGPGRAVAVTSADKTES